MFVLHRHTSSTITRGGKELSLSLSCRVDGVGLTVASLCLPVFLACTYILSVVFVVSHSSSMADSASVLFTPEVRKIGESAVVVGPSRLQAPRDRSFLDPGAPSARPWSDIRAMGP